MLRALYDIPAPAKLNLFLHVIGRRDDGYHLLQSLFALIDWQDTLHFERRGDGRLARHDLGDALPADDLCLRAARALQQASGCTLGADISIDKRVPWGAGLGGGSSDAASTLLALNRLWGLDWPRARLARVGLALGADVPFFIGGRPAFVEGIGERLTPLPVPPFEAVVIKPAAAIATRDVFTHPALGRDTEAVILSGFVEQGAESVGRAGRGSRIVEAAELLQPGFGSNDLQRAAEDRCAEVAEAARWLEDRLGQSRMTGSGSAVFARVSAERAVAGEVAPPMVKPVSHLLDEVRQTRPGWVARRCRSLDRHPLEGWAG